MDNAWSDLHEQVTVARKSEKERNTRLYRTKLPATNVKRRPVTLWLTNFLSTRRVQTNGRSCWSRATDKVLKPCVEGRRERARKKEGEEVCFLCLCQWKDRLAALLLLLQSLVSQLPLLLQHTFRLRTKARERNKGSTWSHVVWERKWEDENEPLIERVRVR